MKNLNVLVLGNCTVIDEKNNVIKLSALWKSQNIIFIFLRHFGCIACRGHATQIWKDRAKYEAGGGKIIFIGNGKAEYIQFFKQDLNISDAPIYTDPTLQSFKAAGFNYGFRSLVNLNSVKNAINLYKNGHRQGAFDNDTGVHWQLGGILVIKSDSTVGYHYISESLGDFSPENDFG